MVARGKGNVVQYAVNFAGRGVPLPGGGQWPHGSFREARRTLTRYRSKADYNKIWKRGLTSNLEFIVIRGRRNL